MNHCFCGWLIDRFGVRIVLSANLAALGAVVIAMSLLEGGGADLPLPTFDTESVSFGSVRVPGMLFVLVMLTRGAAHLTDPVNGDSSSGGSASLAAVAGYPSVTVPAAQIHGLPVGVSFVGRAWSEAKLLALAADFETRTQARREPKYLPTAEER